MASVAACAKQIIVVLLVSLSIASACRSEEYELNGQCCSLCEAGSHVSQHCTALQETECTHCSNGTYIDRPSWLTECRTCKVCDSVLGLFVRHQCSRVKNTVCSCLKEFFCLDGDGESCRLCRKRRVCQPGQRVKMQDHIAPLDKRHRLPLAFNRSAPSDLQLPVKLGSSSLTSQPPLLTGTPGCSVSSCSSSLPPPSLPLLSSSKNSISSAALSEATPSTSDNQPQNFSSGRVRSPPLPGWASNPWLERTTNSVGVRAGAGGGAGLGVGVGLALFGVSTGSRALCHSLVVENGCQLLYIVEDQRWELEGVFSQEHLTHTRVLRSLHTDIVLRDQCVSGVVVCSPPDEASVIILDALRAGKGVLCEKLPSLNRHIAESCFDEASRCGKPLVCGFFKRFDPALQFLYKRVHENETVGRIQRISTVSRMYPPPSVAAIKSSGGIFYNTAVHDIDVICWLLGERAPDTIFSLGHAFCREMAAVKEPDSISVSMKFPSGAIASLDTSQHCNKSCDQRLEVHGTEGSLQMDNRNPLGISDNSTSAALCLQDTAERYRDAYRELLRHFLRTLRD
ncbi:UNVERIFIED_CONTAM: hypothetical protein FKN15_044236 [Acipenser sinensis]